MPQGKRAGERCVQLTDDFRCAIFGDPRRPAVCVGLKANLEMCGSAREHPLSYLSALERLTQPEPAPEAAARP